MWTLDYSLNTSNAEPASSRYEQKKVLMVRFVRPTTTMVLVVESVVMVLSRCVSAGQALWVPWRVLLVSDVWPCQPLHSAHAPNAASRSIPGYIFCLVDIRKILIQLALNPLPRPKMSGLFGVFFTTWGPREYTTGKIMSGTSPARTHKCILNTTYMYKHPHKQVLIPKLSHLNIVFCIIIKSFIFHFTHINRYNRLLPNRSLKLIYILTSDHGAQNVVRTT